jgi:cellulose synthase/poly-beta-1,6-N-acetylglucosamine synthase-like glycosyltransferase
MALIVYYVGLWTLQAVLARTSRPRHAGALDISAPTSTPWHFYMLVPALNEERVIEKTITNLRSLDLRSAMDRITIVVVDDASDDRTADIVAEIAERDPRVKLVHTRAPLMRIGKGNSLNQGFAQIMEWREQEAAGSVAPLERGAGAIVGVVDADGVLDQETLTVVAAMFDDPLVGQLQIGVTIQNAESNMLLRMQDIEFVGFSGFVQRARDYLGSVGLGGNGQFTRLEALSSLGTLPWRRSALTEDLDLGLSLVERGWKTRFTNVVFVHQQGLSYLRPLLRQRTRWIQGHYQCWTHLPKIWRSKRLALVAKLDLSLYLVFVVGVAVVSFVALATLLSYAGLLSAHNSALQSIGSLELRRYVEMVLLVAPLGLWLGSYQKFSRHPLRWYEIPFYSAVFALYTYVWSIATVRAWSRAITRRRGWTKTSRELQPVSLDH